MSDSKKNAPKRRFEEFSNANAWEQRELGEVVQITMGQSPNGTNYTENPNDYILVQGNADMKNGQVVPRIWTKQITKTAAIGDIILSVRAPVGDVGKTNYNVVLGRGVAGIKGDEFIYQVLFKMRLENYWAKYSTGSTFESINSNDLKEAKMFVPKELEKKEIGIFFKQLDNTIALHQRKLEKIKALKTAYLSEMFPAEGESKPKRRFAGFTDDWEQRKLGDLMNITSVKRIHKSDWTDKGVRFLRARDIVSASKGKNPSEYLYISKKLYDEHSKISGKVGVGDLLVTGVGSIGIPMLIKHEEPLYFKDGNIIWFQNKKNIDGGFFYYSFISYSIQKFIRDSAGIGTVGTYTIDSGGKTPIYLPNKKEQQKIGTFFQQLDDTIALHQRKLQKLQNIKKAYLNEMFI
ncbi:restriction endonuclease subunit S [Listeria seeligeri]|uniref:restriction endonuclease subunit S n=1 Tax=Listeria seeligeri TaxID=1640 RepID=UPI001889AF48|nr:restriction endonuclease subunit S [Listeria seeligeri]MBF2672285.1 restriction endonuclease subunit S [Listeria seeligeri]